MFFHIMVLQIFEIRVYWEILYETDVEMFTQNNSRDDQRWEGRMRQCKPRIAMLM
jgi:hypothetical protein